MTSVFIKDFPGGPVVKNPLCNAEDPSLTPDQGTKIPHAVATEPTCHDSRACEPSESPRTTARQAGMPQLRPGTAKN